MPTDGELLMRFAKHGDTAALALVVDRHGAMVWSVCNQVLVHRHEADDAYQATFLILAQKASSIRATDSVGGWLYRVAHRTALAARRRRKQRREQELVDQPLAPEEAFPDIQRRQTVSVLMQELRGLPERYQTPLVLRYLEGRSRRAIAEATDATVGAIAGRLVRGKRLLRQRLARRGVSLAVALAAMGGTATAQAAAGQTAAGASAAAFVGPPPLDPTFALSAASSTVSQLVYQGVRSMLLASLAKPAAIAATGIAAIALWMADPLSGAPAPANPPGSANGASLVLQATPTDEMADDAASSGVSIAPAPSVVLAQSTDHDNATRNATNEWTVFAPVVEGKPVGRTAAPTQAQFSQVTQALAAAQPVVGNQHKIAALEELVETNREVWNQIKKLLASGQQGGTVEKEAQARAEYLAARARLAHAQGRLELARRLLSERVAAAQRQVDSVGVAYHAGRAPLDVLLDATRRRAEAKIALAQAEAVAAEPTPQPAPRLAHRPAAQSSVLFSQAQLAHSQSDELQQLQIEAIKLDREIQQWRLRARAAEMMSAAHNHQSEAARTINAKRKQEMKASAEALLLEAQSLTKQAEAAQANSKLVELEARQKRLESRTRELNQPRELSQYRAIEQQESPLSPGPWATSGLLNPNQPSQPRMSIQGDLTSGGPPQALTPPSEQDVIEALAAESAADTRALAGLDEQVDLRQVKIKLQKVAEYLDPPRVYPPVGRAQMHHAHYKVELQAPGQEAPRVVWLDHQHLHVVDPKYQPQPPTPAADLLGEGNLFSDAGATRHSQPSASNNSLAVAQELQALRTQLDLILSTHGVNHPKVKQLELQIKALSARQAAAAVEYASPWSPVELATSLDERRFEATKNLQHARAKALAQKQQAIAEQQRLKAERAVAVLRDQLLETRHELQNMQMQRHDLEAKLKKAQSQRERAEEAAAARQAAEAVLRETKPEATEATEAPEGDAEEAAEAAIVEDESASFTPRRR